MRQKIDLLMRQVFGARSEKLDPAQLLLLLQGDGAGKTFDPGVAEAESGRSEKASRPPRKERAPRCRSICRWLRKCGSRKR